MNLSSHSIPQKMSTYNVPDYKAKFFEIKVLDKIVGQPTIDNIIKLLRQIKRNAQRVPTTLGGGQLGYLALVIDNVAYRALPNALAFHRPTDPGNFSPVVPVGIRAAALTAGEIALQKIAHDERKRLFNEVQAVEVALRNQIVEAIDDDYLQPLRDTTTDMINSSIPDIFTFLRDTYGKLSPAQLRERERAIDDLVYNPEQNVDTIFTQIQTFQDLCELLKNGKTDTQLVTYAYLCFQNAGIFQNSLKDWNAKPLQDQTFNNFKLYMRKEYNELQAVGGLTVPTSSLNLIRELKEHNELLTDNLKNEIQNGLFETIQALNISSQNQENIPPNMQPPSFNPPPPQWQNLPLHPSPFVQQHDLNQMTSDQTTINQLLQEMQNMRTTIDNLTLSNRQSSHKGSFDKTFKGSFDKTINPRTGQPWKRYCWSCGCCPHWSRNCPAKKKGHQNDATFSNRMDGSNVNCK